MSPIYTIKIFDEEDIYVTEYKYDAIEFLWKRFLEFNQNLYSPYDEESLACFRNQLEEDGWIDNFGYFKEGVRV